MAKIILVVLALALVYWILKGYRRKIDRRSGAPKVKDEDMVRCAQCGVHLPRSDSLPAGQSFYCSAEHRRSHQDRG